MCTDHKNLEYIRTAKKLNSRQVRWSLFLTYFNFTLSYQPGSCNVKPDAFSCKFLKMGEEGSSEADTILPLAHLATAITWGVE